MRQANACSYSYTTDPHYSYFDAYRGSCRGVKLPQKTCDQRYHAVRYTPYSFLQHRRPRSIVHSRTTYSGRVEYCEYLPRIGSVRCSVEYIGNRLRFRHCSSFHHPSTEPYLLSQAPTERQAG